MAKSVSRKSAAKKAGKTRKSRPAAKKAAKTRKQRSVGKKAAPARKKQVAARKAPATRKKAVATRAKTAANSTLLHEESPAIAEIDDRIAIVRTNLRALVEQAASYSGASNEELVSNRIAEQEAKLALLIKQRDELSRRGT